MDDGDRGTGCLEHRGHGLTHQDTATNDRPASPPDQCPDCGASPSRRPECSCAGPGSPLSRRPRLRVCRPSASFSGSMAFSKGPSSNPSGSGAEAGCRRREDRRSGPRSCAAPRLAKSAARCARSWQPRCDRRPSLYWRRKRHWPVISDPPARQGLEDDPRCTWRVHQSREVLLHNTCQLLAIEALGHLTPVRLSPACLPGTASVHRSAVLSWFAFPA